MKIHKLCLQTQNISKQYIFYKNVLGFQTTLQEDKLIVKVGYSTLVFKEYPSTAPYHFAFNIPYSLIDQAKEWLEKRVDLLEESDIKIHDFSNWNAKAMYFYDADQNIVEFIGREDISFNKKASFSEESVFSISEIGVPSLDIEKVYRSIETVCHLDYPIYDGSFDRFCAVGDPEGLFILINKEKKDTWFPTDDKALTAPFEIELNQGGKEFRLKFNQEKEYFE